MTQITEVIMGPKNYYCNVYGVTSITCKVLQNQKVLHYYSVEIGCSGTVEVQHAPECYRQPSCTAGCTQKRNYTAQTRRTFSITAKLYLLY
jgi:hypothetical protein